MAPFFLKYGNAIARISCLTRSFCWLMFTTLLLTHSLTRVPFSNMNTPVQNVAELCQLSYCKRRHHLEGFFHWNLQVWWISTYIIHIYIYIPKLWAGPYSNQLNHLNPGTHIVIFQRCFQPMSARPLGIKTDRAWRSHPSDFGDPTSHKVKKLGDGLSLGFTTLIILYIYTLYTSYIYIHILYIVYYAEYTYTSFG